MGDKTHFRQVMGRFATGVTVVTTPDGDDLRGITVNAFMSVSLEPLLVLVSIERKSRTCDAIRESGVFGVSILSEERQYLSDLFAGRFGKDACHFDRVPYHTEATGAPLLEGALGWLDCRVVAEHDGGDHALFLGAVEWMGAGADADPLLYYRGRYRSLEEPEIIPDGS